MYSSAMIAGPSIGGLIIAHFGLNAAYTIDFLSFFVSLFTIFALRDIPKPKANLSLSVWSSLKEGVRYAMSRQELLGTYTVDFVAMVFGMPMALFPAIAQSLGGVKILGLLYAAPAVGSLAISLCSSWTKKIKRQGLAIAIAAALWGMSIICFGLTKISGSHYFF
jgi:MFS family permease